MTIVIYLLYKLCAKRNSANILPRAAHYMSKRRLLLHTVRLLEVLLEITGDDIITSNLQIGRPDAMQETQAQNRWEGFIEWVKSTLWSSTSWAKSSTAAYLFILLLSSEDLGIPQVPLDIASDRQVRLVEKHCDRALCGPFPGISRWG